MPLVKSQTAAWILAAASLLQTIHIASQVLQPNEQIQLYTADTTQHAKTLLKQMPLDGNIGQMEEMLAFAKSAAMDERIRNGGLGSALFVTDPAEINRLQQQRGHPGNLDAWAGDSAMAELHGSFVLTN